MKDIFGEQNKVRSPASTPHKLKPFHHQLSSTSTSDEPWQGLISSITNV